MKVDKSEQWNLDGKCSICRKAKYCSKLCTRAKRNQENFLQGAIIKSILGVLNRPDKHFTGRK